MVYFYWQIRSLQRVARENVRGQMVVRVNGNLEHYNGYVGNKSLPRPLSRATYASTGGAALAYVQHISGDLSTDFYPRSETVRTSLSPRDGKIREPSARISAALICFVCIARYANTKRRATKRAQWRIKVQKDARKFRLTNRAT